MRGLIDAYASDIMQQDEDEKPRKEERDREWKEERDRKTSFLY